MTPAMAGGVMILLIGMSAMDSKAAGAAVAVMLIGLALLTAGDYLREARRKTDQKIEERRKNRMDVHKKYDFIAKEVKKIIEDVDKLEATEKEKILIETKIAQEIMEDTVCAAMNWKEGEDAYTGGGD